MLLRELILEVNLLKLKKDIEMIGAILTVLIPMNFMAFLILIPLRGGEPPSFWQKFVIHLCFSIVGLLVIAFAIGMQYILCHR